MPSAYQPRSIQEIFKPWGPISQTTSPYRFTSRTSPCWLPLISVFPFFRQTAARRWRRHGPQLLAVRAVLDDLAEIHVGDEEVTIAGHSRHGTGRARAQDAHRQRQGNSLA
jgi:hypothetical protein